MCYARSLFKGCKYVVFSYWLINKKSEQPQFFSQNRLSVIREEYVFYSSGCET